MFASNDDRSIHVYSHHMAARGKAFVSICSRLTVRSDDHMELLQVNETQRPTLAEDGSRWDITCFTTITLHDST